MADKLLTVIFDSQGGSAVSSIKASYCDKIKAPKIPTKAQQLLENNTNLISLVVTSKISCENGEFVLTISKGAASLSINSITIVASREWSAFETLVGQANALLKADYTTPSWDHLQKVIEDAKVLNQQSDAVTIGVVYNKLNAALGAMEKVNHLLYVIGYQEVQLTQLVLWDFILLYSLIVMVEYMDIGDSNHQVQLN